MQTSLFGYFSAYPDYGRHVWYHKPKYVEWFVKNAPDFSAELMPDRNYEYEIFSWVDSIASAVTRQQNFVHKALKKGEGGLGRRIAAAAAAAVLLPIAVVLAPISLHSGRGSTLTFVWGERRPTSSGPRKLLRRQIRAYVDSRVADRSQPSGEQKCQADMRGNNFRIESGSALRPA